VQDPSADLVPHELNFRAHPEHQKAALEALYRQVGFARSLLAYELPDGRLKLLDGHLRRDLDPNMEVDVEILDVDDDEARALLLSIDPLAALAETQHQLHRRLMELAPDVPDELAAAWEAFARTAQDLANGTRRGSDSAGRGSPDPASDIPEQYLILITCRIETHQAELFGRLHGEGLDRNAILS
jgi:hypothetical protein